VIRDVEERGITYRITVQGRPTSAQLGPGPQRKQGATLDEVRDSPLYRDKSAALIAAQLAELERIRDAGGRLGDA